MEKLIQNAVEKMGIGAFISEHAAIMEIVHGKIKNAYLRTKDLPDGTVQFMLECLPLAAGLIHVGTGKETFERTIEWARRTRPSVPSMSCLSTLLLLYVLDENARSAADRELWEDIRSTARSIVA